MRSYLTVPTKATFTTFVTELACENFLGVWLMSCNTIDLYRLRVAYFSILTRPSVTLKAKTILLGRCSTPSVVDT